MPHCVLGIIFLWNSDFDSGQGSFDGDAPVKYKFYTYNFFASDSASRIYVLEYLVFAYKNIAEIIY